MTKAGAGRVELARAARAGRRELRRALPPEIADAIERMADSAESISPEAPLKIKGLAGSLAAFSNALDAAYAVSGARVRDLIWRLHEALRPEAPARPLAQPETAHEARAWLALEPFIAWISHVIQSDPDAAARWRPVLIRWIDVANERLTLARYHRADQRARHARALIADPLALVLPGANEGSGWADLLLAAWDLLQADTQAAQGHNRIAAPGSGFGGFYGLSQSMAAPTAEEIRAALDAFIQMMSQPGNPEDGPEIAAELCDNLHVKFTAAARVKIEAGEWPPAWNNPTKAHGAGILTKLRRLLGN